MRVSGGRCRWIAVSVAGLLGLAAILAALTWQKIFDSVYADQIALNAESRSYREWASTSIPLNFDIYLFNWTNADEFPREKPKLVQLGPYRFRETRRHVNVSWSEGRESIAYRTYRSYEFDAEASNGTLDDNVTTLNPIAVSAIYKSRYDGYFKLKMVAMTLAGFGQKISVSKLARELLFEGYSDSMLDLAKVLPDSDTGGAPKIDKFGWFYGRNESLDSDGYMEVTSGTVKGSLPGQILKWNELDYLPYYDAPCSDLKGSVGEFFPRTLTEDSTLTMFLADLCRTVHMNYVWSGDVAGLQQHTYALTENSFDIGSGHKECFCKQSCAWQGVMNVTACRYGSPVFISLPHLLHADAGLRDAVTGMEPRVDLHSFYFSVEPKLGIPLDVAARFQVNLFIEPNDDVALFKDVPVMLFPIFWVEQRVMIAGEIIDELKVVRSILDWGATFCAGIALFFAAIVALTICSNICLKKPMYVPPKELVFEKTKDEAEIKLNPL